MISWRATRRGRNNDTSRNRITSLALPHFRRPNSSWIGCSDSGVPANVVAGLDPGEVFVHRNVANIVHSSDMNLLSALEFAVEALQVREIIVCGHYGCGGVKAATEDLPHGLADHLLEPVRRLARAYAVDLGREPHLEARRYRLAEWNVVEGVRRVCETPIFAAGVGARCRRARAWPDLRAQVRVPARPRLQHWTRTLSDRPS